MKMTLREDSWDEVDKRILDAKTASEFYIYMGIYLGEVRIYREEVG